MPTAGFILVGGRSRRMGQDKALLLWHSQRLVERVAATMFAVTGAVTLVGHPERYLTLGFPCLADHRQGLGPMAGIETALGAAQGEWSLIAGCDMPDIRVDILRSLIEKADQTRALCIATRDTMGQIHPLCAIYHAQCLPVIKKSLDERRLKLMGVLQELQAEYLPVPVKLVNINTPEDWLHWRQRSSNDI